MAASSNDIGLFRDNFQEREEVGPLGQQESYHSRRASVYNSLASRIFKPGEAKQEGFRAGIVEFCRSRESKLEQGKRFQKGLIEAGTVVSDLRSIRKEVPLSSEYVIAPSPAAVEDVKSKLKRHENQDENIESSVEVVLNTILKAEDLADALYKRQDNYRAGREGDIKLRTYNDDGSVAADIVYRVKMIEAVPGLNAFILTPQDTPEGLTPQVKMIFVGTKDGPGIQRDLEKGAAGNITFKDHEKSFVDHLNTAVGSIHGDDVIVSFIGHSLGGADAQRMALKTMQVFNSVDAAEAADYLHIKKKNMSLRLETSAAPGLTLEQCDEFAGNLSEAMTPSPDKPRFEFRPTAVIYQLDIVPTCGGQHVLAHPEVLSLCTTATVVYAKSALFQHESKIYKQSGELPVDGMEILYHDQQGERNAARLDRMTDVLNRKIRIDIR